MESALVVPIKAFHAAKARLAGTLSPAQRADLAQHTAAAVLAAGGAMDRFVVCDDDEVAGFAVTHDAKVLWMPGMGLNGAVTAAVSTLRADGCDHVVIAHSDLPLADGLDALPRPGTITLVPDRHRDGTNVLALPAAATFSFCYGPASFVTHLRIALASGCSVHVRNDPRLGLDIDRAADLVHPLLHSAITR